MITRELQLPRIYDNGDTTIGAFVQLTPIRKLLGWTCEDQKQNGVKIKKETRIPAGRYKLVINKVLTDLTDKYKKNYAWFKFHIMLEGVPGFAGIYIHIGNSDDDTEGCLTMGDIGFNIAVDKYKVVGKNGRSANAIGESTNAFRRFYEEYYPIIEDTNNQVYLTILDEAA